jgi:hypothetical protein
MTGELLTEPVSSFGFSADLALTLDVAASLGGLVQNECR